MKYIYLVSILLLLIVHKTKSQSGDLRFIIRNSEMHNQGIVSLDFDQKSNRLLSCSTDGLVKIWDGDSLKLINTLRPPVFDAQTRALSCGVFANNEDLAIIAGMKKPQVGVLFLFDIATGRLLDISGEFDTVIKSIAVHDTVIIAASESGVITRLAVSDQCFGEPKLVERVHSKVLNVEFSEDGILGVLCSNDTFFLFRPNLIQKRVLNVASTNARVTDFSFMPQKNVILLTQVSKESTQNNEQSRIKLLSFKGRELFAPDHSVMNLGLPWGNIGFNVCSITPDGEYIFAGTLLEKADMPPYSSSNDNSVLLKTYMFIWDKNGFGSKQIKALSRNYYTDLTGSSNGIYFSSSFPDMGFVSKSGSLLVYKSREWFYFTTEKYCHLSVDETGLEIGFRPKKHPFVSFSITDLRLDTVQSKYSESTSGKVVSDWRRLERPRVNGCDVVFLSAQERFLSADVSDGQSGVVVFGSEKHLSLSDNTGKAIWSVPISSPAKAVNLSGDEKLIVVVHEDGTIKWYSATNGQHLLTLVIHEPSLEWVIYTESGYFMSSSNKAEKLVGWHVQNNWGEQAHFESFSSLTACYRHPVLIKRVLELCDAQAAKKELGLE